MSKLFLSLRSAGSRMLAGALCLCMGQATLAQDGSEGVALRSPENAQKFLAAMAAQYQMNFSPTPTENTDESGDTSIDYFPITISSDAECITRISAPVRSLWTNYLPEHRGGDFGNAAEIYARHKPEIESHGVRTAPFLIDWGKVTEIGKLSTTNPALNSTIITPRGIIIVENGSRFVLGAPTDEIADRMRRAMETLRDACDKTSGLGY